MSRARVYLFADFGKGPRVMYRGRYPSIPRGPGVHSSSLYFAPGSHGAATLDGTNGARRWWLVACASAEDGRYLIAEAHKRDPRDRTVPGRILDSGGQS